MTREKAKEIVKRIKGYMGDGECWSESEFMAMDMAIKALSQEPCDDCIFKNEWNKIGKLLSNILEKHSQKSGKWIVDSTVVEKTRQYVNYECGYRRIINYHMDVHCSKCGFKYAYTTDKEDSIPTNYCPNCGCRMDEPQESEE